MIKNKRSGIFMFDFNGNGEFDAFDMTMIMSILGSDEVKDEFLNLVREDLNII